MAEESVTVAAALSLANKYEAVLAEQHGDGRLTEDRVVILFKVFDQILPKLGVYRAVFKLLRDHLFECIFSEQLTGSSENGGHFIQKLPYFTIVQRIHTERDENAEELQEKLEVVKETLFNKHKAWEESQEEIENLNGELEERAETISNLQQDLAESIDTGLRLKRQLAETHESMDRMEYNMKCDISDLKDDLHEAREEIAFLKKFKHGYDQLQAAFQVQPGSTELFPQRKKNAVENTQRSHLATGIGAAVKLEEQLLIVQNAIVEEFDTYLEDHQNEDNEKSLADSSLHLDMYGSQDFEMDRHDHQYLLQQQRFEKTLEDMGQEMLMLKQHRAGLEVELQNLNSENKTTETKSVRKSRAGSKISQTEELKLEEGEDKGRDPFIVNERFFSKYAAMLYTSDDNAKTFHEVKDARYCPSCGEKTIICPHKILKQEHVFTLPIGVSHIKVSRPKVRTLQDMPDMSDDQSELMEADMTSQMTDDKLSMGSKGTHSFQGSPGLLSSPLYAKNDVTEDALSIEPQDDPSQAGESGAQSAQETALGAEAHLVHTTNRLWENFTSRTNLKRTVKRELSLPRLLSLLEQFTAHIFWWDDYATEDDTVYSILDFVYKFTEDRFIRLDVATLAAHDFMTAIVHYSSVNKLVLLTSHVLVGNYDGAVLRYMLLISEFIDLVEWQTVEDFRAFAAVVYPTLTEDDIETLHIGYTSFSENRISKQLVANYIVHTIIKYREPRFLEMENKLVMSTSQQAGIMTEQEFCDAADALLAVTNEKLMVSLYRESALYVKEMDKISDGVPTLRLAQIASYLRLLSIHALIRETVAEKVAANRDRPSSGKTVSTRISGGITDKLITMASAKAMTLNISRRQQLKKAKLGMEMNF